MWGAAGGRPPGGRPPVPPLSPPPSPAGLRPRPPPAAAAQPAQPPHLDRPRPTTLAAFLAARAAGGGSPLSPSTSSATTTLPGDDRPTFLRDALDGGGGSGGGGGGGGSSGSGSGSGSATTAGAWAGWSGGRPPNSTAVTGTGSGAATTSLAAAAAAHMVRPSAREGAAAEPLPPPGNSVCPTGGAPASAPSGSIAGWQALAAELMGGSEGAGGDGAADAPAGAAPATTPPPPHPPPPLLPSLFAPGGLFFLQYEALRPLGRGAFGAAVLVRRRADGARLVAKVLGGGGGGVGGGGGGGGGGAGATAEATALARLAHPHILRYDAAFALVGATGAVILTGWCAGGDLGTALSRRGRAAPLPPALAVSVLAQLARALAHCHARGVAHRDVKPANVFLMGGGGSGGGDGGGGGGGGGPAWRVRLGDFGLASSTSAPPPSVAGTPAYLAPEVVTGAPGAAGSYSADVWALGCVLFECLSGGVPAFGAARAGGGVGGVGAAILAGSRAPLPPPQGRLGAVAHALVDRLLARSPAARPSAAAVLAFPAVAAAAAAAALAGQQQQRPAAAPRREGRGGDGWAEEAQEKAAPQPAVGPAVLAALAALRAGE